MDNDFDIVDFRRGLTHLQKERIVPIDTVSSELIDSARKAFQRSSQEANEEAKASVAMPDACTVYEHKDFDGLMETPWKFCNF